MWQFMNKIVRLLYDSNKNGLQMSKDNFTLMWDNFTHSKLEM